MKDHLKWTVSRLTPFLLSHHPMCSFFENDTFSLTTKRLCLGCSVSYPLSLITIGLFWLFDLYRHLPEPLFHQSVLLIASLLLGSLQAIKYSSTRTEIAYRTLVKISLGLSIAGLVIWTLTMPVPWPLRLIFLFLGMAFLMFLGSFRILYMKRICAGCIYHGDWDICYGFRGINRYHQFRNVRNKERLKRLIFDKKRKQEARSESGPVARIDDDEPELKDDNRWLYHERGLDIPWLPATGLEVNDLRSVPKYR